MKFLSFFFLLAATGTLHAQDSTRPVEPGYETSFENTELWIIALVGLILLIALYFLFRRKKR